MYDVSRISYQILYVSGFNYGPGPVRMLPCSVRLQKGSNHRIKQKQSTFEAAWLSCSNSKSACSGLKIHSWHRKATSSPASLFPTPSSTASSSTPWFPAGGLAPHARGRLGITPQTYAQGRRRTPRLGSNLPEHDEIPIPNRYVPKADVSEAERQKQRETIQ